MKIVKKIWSDPVWSKVISVGIIACISFIFFPEKSKTGGIVIYNFFKVVLEFLYSLIVKFLNFEIKVWWIITILIIAIGILYVIDKFQDKKSDLPKHHDYKKGNLRGWLWTWEWTWNNSQRAWNVTDLKAHCPKCDTLMIQVNYFSREIGFECPRCNFISNNDDKITLSKIEMLILDNVRRKNES